MLDIVQIPVLKDNYVYLLHEAASGETAVVDPAVAEPVEAALDAHGWRLTHIFNTHHHGDHTGANLALKARHGAQVIGPAAERDRIPGLDIAVAENDRVALGRALAAIHDVPGHTSGHIAWHFEAEQALFCGDTLFSLGCGRLFEGPAQQMWNSLSKLLQMPDDTRVFCAHEYTEANGRFALTLEPGNPALVRRMAEVRAARAVGRATVPSTIGMERATNPFLRPMSEELQDTIGMIGAPLPKIFAEVRARKDRF